MRPPPAKTTQLPKKLVEELGVQHDVSRGVGGKRNGLQARPAARKEKRKAERQRRKSNRTSLRTQQPSRYATHAASSRSDDDLESSAEDLAVIKPTRTTTGPSVPPKSILKAPKLVEPEHLLATPSLSRGLRDRLAQDDAEIAALERKLGIRGKKKGSGRSDDDGLAGLLGGLDDNAHASDDSSGSSQKRRREELEWLERKRRKAQPSPSHGDEEGMSVDGRDSSEDSVDTDGDADRVAGPAEDLGSEDIESEPRALPKKARENPYIAPLASSNAIAPTKYIPPSRRPVSSAEEEGLARLRRRIQGLLNRLSEANFLSILNEAEELYRSEARQHVTSTLIGLLLGLICDRASFQDTFLILHAGFITGVNKVIGMDFGAATVQRLVEDFDRFRPDQTNADADRGPGKERANLVALLAELYNFHVVGSNVVFDFIRMFISELSEVNTELLLRIIRTTGPQLRQDDPSALKEIVLMLQPAVAKMGEANLSVRMRFMMETIDHLKNNRLRTGAAASAVTSEATMRMRKILGSLNTRTLRASEPLRVGLRDIRETDRRGKWWLVGASWTDAGPDRDPPGASRAGVGGGSEVDIETLDDGSLNLVTLAKEQRMNTDVRRAIFVSIMSATDCRDAHLRLTKLHLKRRQEVEIPRVLLHCAGAEQIYNPYYTLIARRLCAEHKLKMAFQFSLWDLFRSMGEGDEEKTGGDGVDEDEPHDLSMRKMVNLAKMYGVLVAHGALGLGVLKHLDWAYLHPRTRMFVELLLITLLRESQPQAPTTRDETTVRDIFSRVQDQASLARGLQYFLSKVVRRTDVAGTKAEKETVVWACGVAIEALGSNGITGEGQT
ncbi:MAG: suppressor of glycerol defect [Thelocarpon superellum]|nr:MAG: suppressor of glycerol defect [Thelocarpon superellum]